MAISNGYCTLAEVRARLDIPDADTDNDSEIENVVEAMSRWIDSEIGMRRGYTQFYQIASEARYFTPVMGNMLVIDDLISVSSIKLDEDSDGTFEVTLASTDYHLAPYNKSALSEPYYIIEITPNASYNFSPNLQRSVEITGNWGYSATTPDVINEACILASMRMWKRRDAIFGVAGTPALGVMVVQSKITQDADVMALLSGIRSRPF